MKLTIYPAIILLTLTACKSVEEITGNNPIVDTKGANVAHYNQDLLECQAYADEVALGQKVAVGTVAGAAVGGIFGAVLGNSNTARSGAGVGAIGGGARGVGDGIREREQVTRNCLIGRGYRVLN